MCLFCLETPNTYDSPRILNCGLPNCRREEHIVSWQQYGKLLTYPSPKPTLTLSSYLGQNIGLGEG